MSSPAEAIRVLHVDDDPHILDLAATFLEREEGIEVETARSADAGLDRLADAGVGARTGVDCIVSDYEMPGMDGLDFLKVVREEYSDLPFILFTGKGSEEIASEAITAGVTDYLNKNSGTSQYALLANRIENTVSQYRSERELREGRAFTRSVFDAIPDVLYAFDEERTMLQWNDQLSAVTGYSDTVIAEMTPLDFVADEDMATLKQTSARVFGEGVVATDRVDLVTKAGEHVSSELTAAPITDEDGTIVGLTGTGRDLTERKKRERELERRTDLLERTQAIANVGGWEFDPVNDELRWTDEVHRIHGVSLDYEPSLKEATEFYHPEDVPVVEAAVERAIETGESFDEELRLIAADDTQRWVRVQGEPRRVDGETVLLRGVFQDITERIERERRYDAIFDQTFQFTGLMEPDGTLIEANETARRFGGVEPEDVIGEYIWDSYWWEISAEARERVREAVPRAAEGEFVRYEEEVKSAEGSAIIDFSIKPVTDGDGEVVLLIPEGRDITEMKEYERELETMGARFRSLTENTTLGVVTMDEESTVRYANDAVADLFGYAPDELVGESVTTVMPDRLTEDHFAAVGRYLEGGERALDWGWTELPARHADGHEVPVGVSFGEYVVDGERRFTGAVRDITAQKERETELEERSTAMETSMDGMAILDAEGRYTYVNQAHGAVYGYDDPENFVGEHWEMYYDDEELQFFEREVMPVLKADGQWRGEATGKRRDGTTFPQEVSLTALDEGLVCAIRDITERKEHERELVSTRDTLSTLLANIPAGVLAEDASRNVLFANEGFCDLFDIDAPPEALVGADCRAAAEGVEGLFADGERFMQTNAEYVAEQATAERETFELVDGRVLERSATPISIEDDENRFLWVYQDITGRVERERAIERERDRFATLFENIPDPSVTVDLETGEAVTRSVNTAFEVVFGYAAETVVGESLNDLIVPPDRLDEATALDRGALDGECVETEVCRQTANGDRREFLFRNVPIEQGEGEAFGIYTDVTERREHERYHRRLYEITADAELATDEVIERALELGCEYLGTESGFLTHIENDTQRIVRANSPHEALQPGGECPLSEAYCRKTIEMDESMTVAHAGTSGWEGDPAYERFGLEAYVGATLTVENDRYGTVCFADRTPREREFSELERAFVDLLVGGIESTLERHKYETEIERQNDQLQEFAGVVSHDLRNPLTVANGFLELAHETGDDEYFTRIGNAHDRMGTIIEDVLTLARQGEHVGETHTVDLEAIATDAWENVATGDGTLAKPNGLGTVEADEGRLKQLFENLYRNAVEHAGENPAVRIGRYSGGFFVEDDGPGIPESERAAVFDSGYTTADENGGSGLGLSIVDTIAAAHGWNIEVCERTGGGARFEVQVGMTRGGSEDLSLAD